MEELVSLGIVCGLIVATALGVFIQRRLPAHHRNSDSKDIVIVGLGALGMLTGLVLGLLIASTTDSFNSKATSIQQFASGLEELDRALRNYGPPAGEARAALARYARLKLDATWTGESGMSDAAAAKLDNGKGVTELESIGHQIRGLKPADSVQTNLQSRAMDLYYRITDARWAMASSGSTSLQAVFLVMLFFWLAVMFVSLGIYAPANSTVLIFLLMCAASFGAAIYIMLEMQGPFSGFITIASQPMRDALAEMAL